MAPSEGAVPGSVFARIDSVEHRLRDELAEQRQEQGSRNEHVSSRLNEIELQLASINTGIRIGLWLLSGGGAVALAALAGVIHLVTR